MKMRQSFNILYHKNSYELKLVAAWLEGKLVQVFSKGLVEMLQKIVPLDNNLILTYTYNQSNRKAKGWERD
jgi:hypothetical protein